MSDNITTSNYGTWEEDWFMATRPDPVQVRWVPFGTAVSRSIIGPRLDEEEDYDETYSIVPGTTVRLSVITASLQED